MTKFKDEEQKIRRGGPNGPDGKPLFARLSEFISVYLVFASDLLVRVGKMDKRVFDHYLTELRKLNPGIADAFVDTAHCTVSFLTDTTTLKLMKTWLAEGENITANGLYNIIIGQTIIPNWRRIEALGPFDVLAPPSPEEFAKRFNSSYPGQKAVVPSHLKQGVLGPLGTGKEVDIVGRFIHDLAAKIPETLDRVLKGDALTSLQEDLGIPPFRALLVVRLLSIADPTLFDYDRRDIGDYAELGLWLLLGMTKNQARAAVLDSLTDPGVDPLFAALIDALPAAIAEKDRHGIVDCLAGMHLAPLCAQNIEHMLCEWRKMVLPDGRRARGAPSESYADLWHEAAPILARRSA